MPVTVSSLLRRTGRIVLPGLVLVPVCVFGLWAIELIGDSFLTRASLLALLPCLSLAALVKSFGASLLAVAIVGVLSGLGWLIFVAYALHKVALLVTAEDFDWPIFWGGLVIGSIPGALIGWRVWIGHLYQVTTLLNCLVVGGLLGGLILAIYLGSCWSKVHYR